MELNYFTNTKSPQVVSATTINDWFELIKTENRFTANIIKARNNELDYNQVKLFQTPAVTINFIYDDYKIDENIIGPTGAMYIDIDDPSFSMDLLDQSKILAMYHSFGGLGWSLIVKVYGLTKENFKSIYEAIIEDLQITKFVDKNAIKASQYNVLSHDPNIFINEKAKVYIANDLLQSLTVPQSSVIYNKRERAYTPDGGTLAEFIPLRFNDLNKIEIQKDYIVNWDGYEWIRCFIPMKKHTKGRNNLLLSYCNNLVWLNSHISFEKCLSIMCSVNTGAFESPCNNDQVIRVVKSIFKYKEAGTLQPIYNDKRRKIVFKAGVKLTKEEKLDVCRKELALKRSNDSKNKIYSIIESWDFTAYGQISIRNISKNHPISKKTVAKYWSEFKDFTTELNKNIIKV